MPESQPDRQALVLVALVVVAHPDRAGEPDVGLLYVLGVNGQILMHYAALRGYEWNAYIEAMRAGERKYGPVRTGLYTRAEAR